MKDRNRSGEALVMDDGAFWDEIQKTVDELTEEQDAKPGNDSP